jgi:hypothetical protein
MEMVSPWDRYLMDTCSMWLLSVRKAPLTNHACAW